MLVPQVPVPQNGQTGPDDTSPRGKARHRRGARPRETQAFIVGCTQTCKLCLGEAFIFFALDSRQTSPELWRETPPLSSKLVLRANILEKISWSKACHCLCLKKQDRPCGMALWQRLPLTSTPAHRSPKFPKPLTRPKPGRKIQGEDKKMGGAESLFLCCLIYNFFPAFLLFMSRNLDGFPQKKAD